MNDEISKLVKLCQTTQMEMNSERLHEKNGSCFNPDIINISDDGPSPKDYSHDETINSILNRRSDCCEGCRWHPRVCDYCELRDTLVNCENLDDVETVVDMNGNLLCGTIKGEEYETDMVQVIPYQEA